MGGLDPVIGSGAGAVGAGLAWPKRDTFQVDPARTSRKALIGLGPAALGREAGGSMTNATVGAVSQAVTLL
jgi:hypothetical protein